MNPHLVPRDDDFRPNPAELAAWTEANRRCREEYRAHPFYYRGHK